jgi:hypothetical protein
MFNPRAQVRRVPIADGANCTVVDDILLEPELLLQRAIERRAAFTSAPGNFYPGIEQPLWPEFDQGLAEFFTQHLRNGFDAQQVLGLATRMSLVTLRPEQLSPQQRICHRDASRCEPGEGACAAVLYLFQDARLGGTSFYRPRVQPAEIDHLLQLARLPDYRPFGQALGAPPGYFSGDAHYFERVCTIPPAWNRAIFYDATIFHSGQIDAPELMDRDPAKGRLTVNAFFRLRKNAG